MADTLTTNLKLTNQTEGANNNTWGSSADANFERIDDVLGDLTTVNTTGGLTILSDTQEFVAIIVVTGTLVSNVTIEFSARGGKWIIDNQTTEDFTVTVLVSGQTGVEIPQGFPRIVYSDGTDIQSGYTEASLDGDLAAIAALSGTGLLKRTGSETWALDDGTVSVNFVIGDGVNVITTGLKGDFVIPFAGNITEAWLLADQSGSIVVDLWKDTYTNYPPLIGDTITASALPTLSSETKYKDVTLTGWTISIVEDDIIRVNVNSITTCTRVTLTLVIERFT